MLYIFYIFYILNWGEARDVAGVPKGETFAITREQTEGSGRDGTENADVAAA